MTGPYPPEVMLRALDEPAHHREVAEAARDAAMADLAEAVREAHEAGVPIVQLAERARVTRTTIYRMLDDGHDESPPPPG